MDQIDRRPRIAAGMLAVAMLVTAVLVLRITRGTTFFFDEWNFVQERRGGGVDSFLDSHNGHLSLVPVAIYKLYFELFGLDDYLPFKVTVLALHLVSAGLLYAFARKRVTPLLALAASLTLLLLGSGWENILWPFQIGYLASIASGLGALLALERDDQAGRRLATLLLIVSLSSSGVGAAFTIAIAARILWHDRVRDAVAVTGPPIALYAIWYALYGDSQATRDTVVNAPRFAADMVAGAFGGLSGLGAAWGPALAFGAVAMLVYIIARRGKITLALATVLLVPITFWVLTAISRAGAVGADSSRYVYVGVLGILLVTVQLARGSNLRPLGYAGLYLLVAFSILANANQFRNGAQSLRSTSATVKAELGAIEIAQATVASDYRPDTDLAPQIFAGSYLQAVALGGSPADSITELQGAPGSARTQADRVLFEAERVRFTQPSPLPAGGRAPQIIAAAARTRTVGPCATFEPRGKAASATLAVGAPGLIVDSDARGPIKIQLKRFADSFKDGPRLIVNGPAAGLVSIPPDAYSEPWTLQLSGAGDITACSPRG